jgi:phosphate transport system substrate-binding protein
MSRSIRTTLEVALLAVVGLQAAFAQQVQLTGAGASFPYPIYSKWFDEYHKKYSNIQINYQSIGSGGGIQQVTAGTVDFGASDGPMTDQQIKDFHDKRGSDILHFPTVLGGVVPTYNIPGINAELNFTPEAIAGIFLGKITKWSDPAIAGVNSGVKLPNLDIVVVHRADSSGTSYCFTDYLSKVSNEWETKVGRATQVKWPTGLGGKGNEGVAGQVKQTPGSIGYVELIYAIQNHMSYGKVKNAGGQYILASLAGVTAAAASLKQMPDDFRVSITNAQGAQAYPISTFTWLLVPDKIGDAAKLKATKDFLQWMLTDGQKMTESLAYAPLPASVVAKETKAIAKIH